MTLFLRTKRLFLLLTHSLINSFGFYPRSLLSSKQVKLAHPDDLIATIARKRPEIAFRQVALKHFCHLQPLLSFSIFQQRVRWL
ncbi:MAG: hypothetical protein CL811_10950 [Colwelliaceae bacterium]|nr:hypothetical protein [Colwelliaceae bacterium]